MKIKPVLLLICVLAALPVSAQQAIQHTPVFGDPTGNTSSYSVSLQNIKAGDTLVLPFVGQASKFTDTQGNTWTIDVFKNELAFAHALNVAAGSDTVNVTLITVPTSFVGILAEYPPASSIQVSQIGAGSEALATSPSLTGSGIALGFGVNWTSNGLAAPTPGTGFTVETSRNLTLEDGTATGTALTTSLTWPQVVNWFQGIAILNTAPPPPPPQAKNFSFSGQVSWDDGTPLQGTVTAAQISGNTTTMLGSVTPDASGNISGTITVQTNFADLVNLQFSLVDSTGKVTAYIQATALGAMFKGISGVSGFHLIFIKASCTSNTPCVPAPNSVFGTIQ